MMGSCLKERAATEEARREEKRWNESIAVAQDCGIHHSTALFAQSVRRTTVLEHHIGKLSAENSRFADLQANVTHTTSSCNIIGTLGVVTVTAHGAAPK